MSLSLKSMTISSIIIKKESLVFVPPEISNFPFFYEKVTLQALLTPFLYKVFPKYSKPTLLEIIPILCLYSDYF